MSFYCKNRIILGVISRVSFKRDISRIMFQLDETLPGLLQPLAKKATAGRIAFVLDYLERTVFHTIGNMPTDREIRDKIKAALQMYGGDVAPEGDEEASQPPEYWIYNRLRKCGWIAEYPADNFRQTVGLSVGGREVLDFIRKFNRARQDYTSQVLMIFEGLKALVGEGDSFVMADKIKEHALTLPTMADHATTMRRHFARVWEFYREAEMRFTREADHKTAFNDYFGNHLKTYIVDWISVNTTHSPLRFEAAIRRMLNKIDYMRNSVERRYIIEALIAANKVVGETQEIQETEASRIVDDSIETIRNAFEDAKLLQEEINKSDLRLARLVNARYEYIISSSSESMERIREARRALDGPGFDALFKADAPETLPNPFYALDRYYEPDALKVPDRRYTPPADVIDEDTPMTPEEIEADRQKNIYNAMGHSTPRRMIAFLRRQGIDEAGRLRINDLEAHSVADVMDLIAFYSISKELLDALASEGLAIEEGHQLVKGRYFTGAEIFVSTTKHQREAAQ